MNRCEISTSESTIQNFILQILDICGLCALCTYILYSVQYTVHISLTFVLYVDVSNLNAYPCLCLFYKCLLKSYMYLHNYSQLIIINKL